MEEALEPSRHYATKGKHMQANGESGNGVIYLQIIKFSLYWF